MLEWIRKMIANKKEYREQMARAAELPPDYRFVFEKIHAYIWRFAGGDGSDMQNVQSELIELFEARAAEGKPVLAVTGADVAAFCDDLLRGTKKWTDPYREQLNQDMQNRLYVRLFPRPL